ncbi:hypothetical protein RFI_29069 [Reticulomyxa filosa]|uniref:Uncharacterized protein n=1 Tax=Reticulomyxa filosa TaxID=46433 RepID=X6M2Z6_RETFI|nr:hypothetical protein RFI_29069 [Reticulomyxa filosa]|eukprot:ETO08319.1 hypothetical protein RFI_29069 [Reticulomyxa filosa]
MELFTKKFEQLYKIFEGGFLVQHLAKIHSEFVSFREVAEVEIFYSTLDFLACKRSMDQKTSKKNIMSMKKVSKQIYFCVLAIFFSSDLIVENFLFFAFNSFFSSTTTHSSFFSSNHTSSSFYQFFV